MSMIALAWCAMIMRYISLCAAMHAPANAISRRIVTNERYYTQNETQTQSIAPFSKHLCVRVSRLVAHLSSRRLSRTMWTRCALYSLKARISGFATRSGGVVRSINLDTVSVTQTSQNAYEYTLAMLIRVHDRWLVLPIVEVYIPYTVNNIHMRHFVIRYQCLYFETKFEDTALLAAARCAKREVIKLLLQTVADLDKQYENLLESTDKHDDENEMEAVTSNQALLDGWVQIKDNREHIKQLYPEIKANRDKRDRVMSGLKGMLTRVYLAWVNEVMKRVFVTGELYLTCPGAACWMPLCTTLSLVTLYGMMITYIWYIIETNCAPVTSCTGKANATHGSSGERQFASDRGVA